MLNDGKGGMGDFAKYRELLTDIFWHGKLPDQDPQTAVEAANAAIGQATPAEAMAEARAIYEKAKAASQPTEGDVH